MCVSARADLNSKLTLKINSEKMMEQNKLSDLLEAEGTFYHGTKADVKGWIGSVTPETAHSSFDRLLGPHFSGTPDIANKFATKNPNNPNNKGGKFGGKVYPAKLEGEIYVLPQGKLEDWYAVAVDALRVTREVDSDLFDSYVAEFIDHTAHGTISGIEATGQTANVDKIVDAVKKIYFESDDYGGAASIIRLSNMRSPHSKQILQLYKDHLLRRGYGVIEYKNTGRHEKVGLYGDKLKSYIALAGSKSIFEGAEEVVNEVNMSPTALEKFAQSEDAARLVVGAEFELYFKGKLGASAVPNKAWNSELTWDDIEAIAFEDNPDAITRLEEKWQSWYDDKHSEYVGRHLKEKILDAILDHPERSAELLKHFNDKAEFVSAEKLDEILDEKDSYPKYTSSKDFEKEASENEKLYSQLQAKLINAVEKMGMGLFDNFVEDALGESPQWSGSWWEYYEDELGDELILDFEAEVDTSVVRFLEYKGIYGWHELSSTYGGSLGNGEGWDSDAAERLAVSLGRAIGDDVEAYDEYKSDDAGDWVERGVWVMEPDSSVTGHGESSSDLGIEIKSPPLPLPEFLEKFDRFVSWAKNQGGYTNKQTGLHLNMSIEDGDKIDYLKLVLFAGADKVSRDFQRSSSAYAKSNLNMLRKALTDERHAERAAAAMTALKAGLVQRASREIANSNDDRYFQINFKYSYVEFRAPGNDWLGSLLPKVKETLYRFGYALTIASNPELEQEEYAKKLAKLLGGASEDMLSPFIYYAVGVSDKNTLKAALRTRSMYRKMRFDPAKMSVEDFKQVFKENGLNTILVVNRDSRRSDPDTSRLHEVEVENLIQVGRIGSSSDGPIYRYLLRFEQEGKEPMFVDTIQQVYLTKQGTTEILGITDGI